MPAETETDATDTTTTTTDPGSTTLGATDSDGDTETDSSGSSGSSGSSESSSTGEPPPSGTCDDEPGNLAELWRVGDGDRERGESVSVADGRVVWVASAFAPNTRIRAHDLDGMEQWSADVATTPGEGGLRRHGIAAGSITAYAGTGAANTAQLVGFDDTGQVVFEHAMLMDLVDAGGVAIGSDGAILFGGSDEDLHVRLFDDQGMPLASDVYDHGGDEHVFNVTADAAGGYFVAGHSNLPGRPLLARVDAGGALEWIVEASAGVFEVAHGVASDGEGGAWLAVAGEGGAGRLDHFDANGDFIDAIPLGFGVQQVVVDASGGLVVLGRMFPTDPILVQRLSLAGDVLAEASLPGTWGLDLAIDDTCDVYVVGSEPGGAYLVKLD